MPSPVQTFSNGPGLPPAPVIEYDLLLLFLEFRAGPCQG